MTILHIISSMRRGGRERQLAVIAKHCIGMENRILYYNESPGGYIEQYGLQSKAYHCAERSLKKRILATAKRAKEMNADVIVSWGNMESVIAMFVSVITGIPFVNFSIRHGIRSKQFSHYFRTLILHLSKYIVANSHAGLKANNLKRGYVLYNGIEAIEIQPEHSLAAKEAMSIPTDDPAAILISVANLVPYKDYYTVFAALNTLKKEGFPFRYYIIGEGPLRADYERYLKRHQLDDCVFLLGRIVHPHAFLAHADVFIHSSKGEGCSNAILEAMYMGLPIVTSDTGGTAEIVEDNALLFPYKDAQALQQELRKLLTNSDLRQKMGQSSKSICTERFSLERMLTDYHKILTQILKK
ncbi:MAG: glycosyltransferase [Candidatus Cloacimonetes bacterium]|nr:glycosyltransferase [Candidatus Cloacimonadota bacterium]